MNNQAFPNDGAHVVFTDMQGIERKGYYKKDAHGYVELSEVEMPLETKYVYPEDEIVRWEHMEEPDADMTRFVL